MINAWVCRQFIIKFKPDWRTQMQVKFSPLNCTILLVLLAASTCARTTCSQSDKLVGCQACTDNTSHLILDDSTNLYACSDISSCVRSDSSDRCLQCSGGYVLDLTNNQCLNNVTKYTGCTNVTGGSCGGCISSSYQLVKDTATNSNICKLVVIDYCWRSDASGCIRCSDQNIKSPSNCSVQSCKFDYEKWVCLQCNNSTSQLIHQSGVFCYTPVDYCLIYAYSGCIQCQFGYFLTGNATNITCTLDSTFSLWFQLLPLQYYYNSSAEMVRVCLDSGKFWDSTLSPPACANTSPSNTVKYCQKETNGTCDSCVQSYYSVSGSRCKPCMSAFANCLICDSLNCKQCLPTHFLVLQSNTFTIFQVMQGVAASNVTQCLSCSIYGCQYCRSEFDSQGTFNVRCDKCLFGYKLYNHTCLSCPKGTYFNQTNKNCTECFTNNMMYCNDFSTYQCNQGYYYDDKLNKTCRNMTEAIAGLTLNDSNTYEILNKSLPYSSTAIINDTKLLMTNCNGSSNGFACLCNATPNNIYTSLCYYITPSITALTFNLPTLISNSTYNTQTLIQNTSLLLLLSELPKFTATYAPIADSNNKQLISNSLLANYLQITTNFIRNNPVQLTQVITSISSKILNVYYKTFDPNNPTILFGPGYYFKYTPANPEKIESSVVSLSSNTIPSFVYIYFNSSTDSSLKRITGSALVFTNQSSPNLNLQLKKINFLGSNQNYMVYSTTSTGDSLESMSITSDVDGYVTIPNIVVNTPSTGGSSVRAYFVSAVNSAISADLFASQRIQNLIYRVAFIYILVFLTLYLTLIPFCALVDCVDSKSHKRKLRAEEQGSYQGIKHRSETEGEQQVALKINYKDFFPIYNIANTERPRRLLKLCLFLVNSQHSITFLTLIYFRLPAGQPLVAVLLAIPAYICTVIMGYLCGILTLKLPGKTKYLINLLTIGYWILWVAIMSNFVAYQYAPYVFTFAIIFFFIDMLIDFLETLLMYFTIKQESRQIKLFKALSRWLSYRGYYEFDKMAKAIDEIRDNS